MTAVAVVHHCIVHAEVADYHITQRQQIQRQRQHHKEEAVGRVQVHIDVEQEVICSGHYAYGGRQGQGHTQLIMRLARVKGSH